MKNGLIIDADGTKYWYLEGKLHRVDGPAIEYANGSKQWFLEDKLHRVDGPAIEDANGFKRWWFCAEELKCSSQEEFKRLIRLKAFW